jgi:hypothetical protein
MRFVISTREAGSVPRQRQAPVLTLNERGPCMFRRQRYATINIRRNLLQRLTARRFGMSYVVVNAAGEAKVPRVRKN